MRRNRHIMWLDVMASLWLSKVLLCLFLQELEMFVWTSHSLKDAVLRKLHWFTLLDSGNLPAPYNPQKQALWGHQSNWQWATFKALLYLTFPQCQEEDLTLPIKGLSGGQRCWIDIPLALCHNVVSVLFALFLWHFRWNFSSEIIIQVSKLGRWLQNP